MYLAQQLWPIVAWPLYAAIFLRAQRALGDHQIPPNWQPSSALTGSISSPRWAHGHTPLESHESWLGCCENTVVHAGRLECLCGRVHDTHDSNRAVWKHRPIVEVLVGSMRQPYVPRSSSCVTCCKFVVLVQHPAEAAVSGGKTRTIDAVVVSCEVQQSYAVRSTSSTGVAKHCHSKPGDRKCVNRSTRRTLAVVLCVLFLVSYLVLGTYSSLA